MNKNMNQLREEVATERKEIYDAAFELYCKYEIARQMDIVNKAEKDFDNKKQRKESMTIKKLEEEFNSYNLNEMGKTKEKYIKIIKGE